MITCNETIYQWDVSRTVDVDVDCEVHFALQGELQALVVASALGKAEIPNILLQDGRDIIAWQVQEDKTLETKRIAVMRRAKPADYVYTETETITFETLVAEVREAVAKSLEQTERAKQAVSTIEKTNADIQQAETKRAEEFKAMGAKTDAGIAKINKAESDIRQAEAKRVEQEFSRTQAEAKREESFTSNLTSWNQKVDAEVAKTSQAITETNKAKDNAITATNKANEAIAQLPLPTGNVLKGEVQGIIAHADDVYTSKALGFNIYGKSSQYTTTGANKFNPAGITNGSSNGITWTKNEDGSITVSGTSTALVNINLVANPSEFILSTGKWTGSVKGANKAKLIVQTLDGVQICNTNTSATRENKTEQGLKYFLLQVQAQTTLNETISVYLEKSDKALYEEYTDGKPSPSPKYPREITNVVNADLSIAGKNLIKLTKADYLHTNNAATYEILDTGVKVSFAKQYSYVGFIIENRWKDAVLILSASIKNSAGKTSNLKVYGTNERSYKGGEYLASSDVPFSAKNYEYLRILFDANPLAEDYTGFCEYTNLMLEAGSTAIKYEPYQESITLPIGLQGNELCSLPNGVRDEVRIDKDGNVELVKRVGICAMPKTESISDGQMQSGADGTKNYVVSFLPPVNAASGNGASCLCTHFSDGGTTKNRDTIRFGADNSHIYVYTSDADVLGGGVKEAVNAWMTTNGVKLLYPLATPIITSLGKIDMPALPAPVCNAWANDENPTDMKFSYIRDVNIAYDKLASALANAMNTPATIPELEL